MQLYMPLTLVFISISVQAHYADDYSSYLCERKQEPRIKGIFVNNGELPMETSVGAVQRGLEILRPHPFDYEKLAGSSYMASELNASDPAIGVTTMDGKITVPGGTITIAYQRNTICSFADPQYKVIRNVLQVHSKLDTVTVFLNDSCRDELEYLRQFGHMHDYTGREMLSNFGQTLVSIPLDYAECVYDGTEESSDIGEIYASPERKDDTDQFLAWINSKLATQLSPSPWTGLDWSGYKVEEVGCTKRQFRLEIEPQKAAFPFQAVATCGQLLKVYGWVFAVEYGVDGSGCSPAAVCDAPGYPIQLERQFYTL